MENRKKELFDSTWDGFKDIREISEGLKSLSNNVHYLHPNLSDEIWNYALELEEISNTLKGNYVEGQNIERKEVHQQIGGILCAFLDKEP